MVSNGNDGTDLAAGGGYIERNREAILIRAEGLVTSLDDVANVVVTASKSGVKARLAEVQKTLPAGVTIEPYYDRSELTAPSALRPATWDETIVAATTEVRWCG